MRSRIASLERVWANYGGVAALEDVNLAIKKNEFLGILGPNGGGKTTLLKVILGLVKPEKGTVKLFGKTPEQGRKDAGYVPQYTNFDKNFPISVFEVALMGRLEKRGLLKGYSKADLQKTEDALKTVGMLELGNRQISQLSGGQLQRVLVARALASQPKLLLLDEPMNSIDQATQKSFYDLLGKLKKKMSIVIVTHDITAISIHVNRIACLNQKLYYHGSLGKGIKQLEKTYQCPIELIAHGVPHRVLRRHDND